MVKRLFLIFVFPYIICSCGNDKNVSTSKKGDGTQEVFKIHLSNQSNLSFSNNVYESKEENYLNYEFIYNGSGVAVGDINNDGLPDIYFSGNSVGDKLYLNKGNLKFEDITVNAGINAFSGWSTGVNMVDINQDGWLDIYVCRSGPSKNIANRTNRLFINQKNNTFKEEANKYGLAISDHSVQSAFFDYDLDGDLDLYLLNHPDPNYDAGKSAQHMANIRTGKIRTDYLFENVNGSYQDKTFDANLYNFGYRHGIAVGDVNNDGYPDLYVSSDFDEPDALFINNGDKTFSNSINESMGHISFNSMGNELADVNNDGSLDLFVVDMAPEDHYRSKLFMASMDVNRFRTLQRNGYHNQYMFNTLQINNSDGVFSEVAQYSGLAKSDWSWGPLFFDMDHDGLKDLIITNGIKENFMYNDLQKDIYVATNGTGQIDIQGLLKLVPSEVSENQIYKNVDGVKFEKRTKDWLPSAKFNSNGIATADFDNDGDMDFVTNNMGSEVTLYESLAVDDALGNYLKIKLKGTKGNLNAIGSKVEVSSDLGVQLTEIHRAKGYLSAIDLPLIFGLGDDELVTVKITWPDNKQTIIKDLAVNKTYTFDYEVVSNKSNALAKAKARTYLGRTNVGLDHNHVEDNYDDYKQQILLPHSQSNVGPSTAKADVNGDGILDLFVGGAAGQSAVLFIGDSGDSFKSVNKDFEADKFHEDTGACFFDADGDGDADLYVVSGGAHLSEFHQLYRDRLYINDGSGNFSKSNKLPSSTNISGQAVTASDFDQDGDMDLFVGGRLIPEKYPFAPESFLLINQNGKFEKQTMNLGDLVSAAKFLDVNGDGYDDLVSVGEWSPISIILNKNGVLDPNNRKIIEGTNGLWFSLNSADIDQDGDMDIFAGNLGLNTKFKVNKKKKFQVYCSDFDSNGTYDVVLSTNYKGYDVPTRGRECSSQQMPFIAEEFKDYHSFASASMDDIYGEELDNALNKQIDILYSVYLENDGSGNFKLIQLPWQSQIAPIQDFEFSDLTGDGVDEIFIVGDLHNVEVETVRYDASTGMILKLENGKFTCLDPNETGFIAMGDARKIEVIEKAGGEKIVVIANNNGPIETFVKK